MSIKFYMDQDGTPRAEGKGKYAVLADFLESDIGGSPDICQEIQEMLEDIDEEGNTEESFNSHTLVISPKSVTIHSEYDEMPPARFSSEEFRDWIGDWQDFLERN